MEKIEFGGEVAIVTGAGQGLGRAHSLELARRGARVVVNDLAGERADAVVEEIRMAGGEAVASHDSAASAAGAQALVATALESFGGLHAVVNNAGIMRNGMIEEVSPEDLEAILAVNLMGPYLVCQAAWPTLREQGYGRIVNTCSSGGLFAMQGEANYAAAKAGTYGLTKALASEGAPHGIVVNALLPMATTTLAVADPVPGHAERYPEWARVSFADRRTTAAVSPFVAFLGSRACEVSGEAFFAGFGRFARVFVGETVGWVGDSDAVTAEDALTNLDRIRDPDGYAIPADIYEQIEHIARSMGDA